MKTLHLKNKKKGQSLIEFLFVSVIFIFMFFLSINAMVAFTVYQYLSYASYMSARAFFAGGATPEESRERAFKAFQQFVPQLATLSLPSSGNESVNRVAFSFPGFPKTLAYIERVYIPLVQAGDYGAAGAVVRSTNQRFVGLEFAVPFAVNLPLGNLTKKYGELKMRTSSFLGREVSVQECRSYFELIKAGALGHAGAGNINTAEMEDQGC